MRGAAQTPRPLLWGTLVVLSLLALVVSLGFGRFPVPADHAAGILLSRLVSLEPFWAAKEEGIVLMIRLPRALASFVAGAGLAVAGAALQGIFRNPLVGPQIIGVSTGAGFGGALAIMLSGSTFVVVASAFGFGMTAMLLVAIICCGGEKGSMLALILAGVVVSAFFTALTSLLKYVADPYDKLPAIVMWLMGSFATVTYEKLAVALPVILGASGALYAVRFRVNVLSLGDEEAAALGVKVSPTRWFIIGGVALITSATVALAGIVGWVGLVIPHVARALVGANHTQLLPASALIGGIYLLLIDNLARTATAMEIPLGVITALVGAPFFALLLMRRLRTGGLAA